MREWLTFIVVLLIVTVVLDGLRRMRNNRRSAIRMSLSMHQGTKKEDLVGYGSELPNGGARVANVREQDAAVEFNHKVKESRKSKVSRTGRPYRIPEQVALNLDEHVPMLMDSVEQQAKEEAKRPAAKAKSEVLSEKDLFSHTDKRIEPSFSYQESFPESDRDSADDFDNDTYGDDVDPLFAKTPAEAHVDDDMLEDDFLASEIDTADDDTEELTSEDEFEEQELVAEDDSYYEDESLTDVENATDDDELEEDFPEPEDVLVLNVMAQKGDAFAGDHLLEVVLTSGMRFGSMNIFHHHELTNGEGGIWYSMANIVKPGTFDLNAMSEFYTPGVSLFMTLPLDGDSKKAFEAMLSTAKAIAVQLNGELKDENRSVLTQQTIEHYRTRIREFERKQLSRAPA